MTLDEILHMDSQTVITRMLPRMNPKTPFKPVSPEARCIGILVRPPGLSLTVSVDGMREKKRGRAGSKSEGYDGVRL